MNRSYGYIKMGLFLLLLTMPYLGICQPGWDDEPDDVPLDGGIALLMSITLFYGAYRLYKSAPKT